MKKLTALSLLFVLLFSTTLNGQMRYSTTNKKAISLFEKALESPRNNFDKCTQQTNYTEAIELLQKALKKDPRFIEGHQLIAEYYLNTGRKELAIDHMQESININPHYDPAGSSYFLLAQFQHENGRYADALKNAKRYLEYGNRNAKFNQATSLIIQSCEFALDNMKNPTQFVPINLGPAINTQFPEYYPTTTVDGKTLLFTRDLPAQTILGTQEDFFVSHLDDNGNWTPARPMPSNINTANNEGAPTFAPDGRTLIFVACADMGGSYGEGRSGRGSCDLFITKKIGQRWTDPKNLPGYVNTPHWETQPSLSSDGKTIYFIRGTHDKERNKHQDIFRAFLQDDGTWSEAERLSDVINTPFREESVCIHPDGRTLYFSSNGHPGYGGIDLFMSRMDDNGNWSRPVNLGYPINTHYDESSLLVSADGEIAFFASDREGGFGDLDLYFFELPEHLRPIRTLYMDGVVFDAKDRKPLAGHFQLIDLKTGKTVVESTADKVNGEFLVSLPTNKDYALNVSYPGYNFYSKNFTLSNSSSNEPYHMDVPLQPITVDVTVRLDNVFFDLGKSNLRPESQVELNKLVDYLNTQKTVAIEIGGHTDTRGDEQENQILSEARAKAVADYVIAKGIAANRITYKGYGETKTVISDEAIAKLKTEEERNNAHQLNRRTEYKIISK